MSQNVREPSDRTPWPGCVPWLGRVPCYDKWFRIPGRIWRDPLGAMVEKELRSLSRCAGFRLAFFMGSTFGILMFFPQVYLARHESLSFGITS